MIPFAGAFISLIDDWKLSRSLFYVVLGCLLKYGIIMIMSNFFFEYFSSGDAQLYTILLIVAVIAISITAAFVKKKREGLSNENS
jgi:membrane protein DedA with SNARE-associated domain